MKNEKGRIILKGRVEIDERKSEREVANCMR